MRKATELADRSREREQHRATASGPPASSERACLGTALRLPLGRRRSHQSDAAASAGRYSGAAVTQRADRATDVTPSS